MATFRVDIQVAVAKFKRSLEIKGQADQKVIVHKSSVEREEDETQRRKARAPTIRSAPTEKTSFDSISEDISEDSEDENPPFPLPESAAIKRTCCEQEPGVYALLCARQQPQLQVQPSDARQCREQQLGMQTYSEDDVLRSQQQLQLQVQPDMSLHQVQETRAEARGAGGAWERSDRASEKPPSVPQSQSAAINEAMEQQPGVLACSNDTSLRIHVAGMTQRPPPTKDDLVRFLEEHGCYVADVEWVVDANRPSRSDAPRVRFAFVTLKDLDSFNNAMELGKALQLHDKVVDGFGKLNISEAIPKRCS